MNSKATIAQIYAKMFEYLWIMIRVVLLDLAAPVLPRLWYLKRRLKLAHASILALVLDADYDDDQRQAFLDQYLLQAETIANAIRRIERGSK